MARAVVYDRTGTSDVLRMIDRPIAMPGAGEVLVRVHVSGVNPTDWKSRVGDVPGEATPFALMVPNQDGAGVIEAVGDGVVDRAVGQRVWLWECMWQRADGTAQDYVVVPARQAVPLPDDVALDCGASLGIPALTAHRCLTTSQLDVHRLHPGALTGARVLVVGGAGAVGHATIQLAKWSGAQVLATVSSDAKAQLVRRAGADHVVNYRDAVQGDAVRDIWTEGADIVVDVAPVMNNGDYPKWVASSGTVAIYAFGGGELFTFPVQSHFMTNTRFQFVLVYTVSKRAKDDAVADVSAAAAQGALPVGDNVGLPLTRFTLDNTAAAHDAVQAGAVGKVLIDLVESA